MCIHSSISHSSPILGSSIDFDVVTLMACHHRDHMRYLAIAVVCRRAFAGGGFPKPTSEKVIFGADDYTPN